MKNRILLIFAVCISLTVHSQKDYKPAPENMAARQWFQDAKFGLFIHWESIQRSPAANG